MANQTERGRPSGSKTQKQVENARVDHEVSREDKAHSGNRPPRVPMVAGQTLNANHLKKAGFHYRWFSNKNEGARMDAAQQAWWEFVKDSSGEKVSRRSGPETLFLMCIEDKFYNEDQQLKQKKIIDTLKEQQNLGKDEYLPDGRHHALQKDDYDPLA